LQKKYHQAFKKVLIPYETPHSPPTKSKPRALAESDRAHAHNSSIGKIQLEYRRGHLIASNREIVKNIFFAIAKKMENLMMGIKRATLLLMS
jgi:hypothetical protein